MAAFSLYPDILFSSLYTDAFLFSVPEYTFLFSVPGYFSLFCNRIYFSLLCTRIYSSLLCTRIYFSLLFTRMPFSSLYPNILFSSMYPDTFHFSVPGYTFLSSLYPDILFSCLYPDILFSSLYPDTFLFSIPGYTFLFSVLGYTFVFSLPRYTFLFSIPGYLSLLYTRIPFSYQTYSIIKWRLGFSAKWGYCFAKEKNFASMVSRKLCIFSWNRVIKSFAKKELQFCKIFSFFGGQICVREITHRFCFSFSKLILAKKFAKVKRIFLHFFRERFRSLKTLMSTLLLSFSITWYSQGSLSAPSFWKLVL